MAELDHFAIISISYENLDNALKVIVGSNNPCHLTLYYTTSTPLTHKVTRIQRGLPTMGGAYWCFAGWTAIPQIEAGDTLIHTFIVPDWAFCQIRWFTFRGTISGNLSPSCGPIIEHHKVPGPLTRFEYLITGGIAYYYLHDIYWKAQTFTPATAHTIKMVNLLLFKIGLPFSLLFISIRNTDILGLPILPDLCLGILDTSTLTTSRTWREITLGDGANLLAGTKYAIVARCPGASDPDAPGWWDAPPGGYPQGVICSSENSGDTWIEFAPNDFLFEEWGWYMR